MTNKVKPFYIRITDDMTPQMVQDALDKCVDAGAIAEECIVGTVKKHRCQNTYYHYNFNYFGIADCNETYLSDDHRNYGGCAQEITLDQLDDWLGVASESQEAAEWNGEGLPPVDVECEMIFNGKSKAITPLYYDDHKSGMVLFYHITSGSYIADSYDWCLVENCTFRKPETPEQKAARERLEAAYDLYTHVQSVRGQSSCGFDWFSNSEMEEIRLRFLAIVDKTNYRKQ